ncbi:MAG: glycosyltransferase family 4 protein [Ignavibacteriota bacterium]
MKILVSCLSNSWGGMEMFAVSSLKLLIESGYIAHLACIKESPIEQITRELPIHRALFRNSAKTPVNILKMSGNLSGRRYDIIHTHASKDLWIIVPALKLLRLPAPIVMTKHVGSAITKKDPLHNLIYKRLDHVIAISNVIRENTIDTTSIDGEKVTVINNFVDLVKYRRIKDVSSLREEFNIGTSTIVLGLVGRITPGKGHSDVIEAVRLLSDGKPDIKIIIAGGSSENEKDFENRLRNQVKEYNLEDYIIFTGYRNDIPELLSMFDIFLFPSHNEAFGLALLEAMAVGIPNIVCFSDGVKDIAVKDVTSLTYDKGHPETLSVQISRLINNSQLREKLSYNSSERAKLFSAEIFQRKIDRLYQDLINKADKKDKKKR